ncbi:protein tirA-like isoform X2 [Glandiceps talaboti]
MGGGVSTSKSRNQSKAKFDEDKDVDTKDGIQGGSGKDIMISYSHEDMDMMRKVKESLESSGVSVWVDEVGLGAGVDFLSKIGEAIVDAKLFLSLLSGKSVKSKYCKDELALAYVSNKPIFPCALLGRDELSMNMDFGMKLTLAPMKWIMFTDDRNYNTSFDELLTDIRSKLAEINEDSQPAFTATAGHSTKPLKRRTMKRMQSRQFTTEFSDEKREDFWEKYFQGKDKVEWTLFKDKFNEKYGPQLNKIYSTADKDWLMSVLYKLINQDENEFIEVEDYDSFCAGDGEKKTFWERVHEEAVISYTMKEVFSVDSSVRLDAIQNLGKFNSSSVVGALLDLITDKDENVRTIAAISLAKTGSTSNQVTKKLMMLLNDKDRLVRESGCLALGHLKVKQAVPKLVQL